jgi:hypothetical protein
MKMNKKTNYLQTSVQAFKITAKERTIREIASFLMGHDMMVYIVVYDRMAFQLSPPITRQTVMRTASERRLILQH